MELLNRIFPTNRQSKVYLQAKDSLHGNEKSRNIEGLEENLSSLLPVLAGVERSFSQQNRMLPKSKIRTEQDY